MSQELVEIMRLRGARGERPKNAAGIGEFWYEPEIWTLPLSPDTRALYAGLCSFLGHKEINRQDLRNTLNSHPEGDITRALEELVRHDLLVPDAARGYEVRLVGEFVG